MTHSIGSFLKSVFPSTVNRSGEVFKALLADGEGGGSIEAIFEELEETRSAWQDVLDAYSLLEEQNEKLWGLVSLLSQSDASEDSVYMARNKMLFASGRASRAPWGSVYDLLQLFKEFFEIDEVWLVNNCATIDESLLTDGDFENQQDVWRLSGCSYCETSVLSENRSVLFEEGGTLRQSVSLSDAGAYFLNFFLQGKARARATNSAGQYWKAVKNGTGEWQDEDAYWEFETSSWDNCQCFFALEGADTVTVEIEGLESGSLVDYARLHLKTDTSMFTILAGFEGGTSTAETAAYSPPKNDKLGFATTGKSRAWIAGDDFTEDDYACAGAGVAGEHRTWVQVLDVNYEKMSYMDDSYIFGRSGMKSQEVSTAFLELVKPAGVMGYVEILTAEADVSVAEEESEETSESDNEDMD